MPTAFPTAHECSIPGTDRDFLPHKKRQHDIMTNTSSDSPALRYRPGPHWIALIATALTWPLLLAGGTVSVYRVGMAVYDWPTTFGVNMFLYKFWNASTGVFLEHTHRLFGSVLGVACIVLAVWFAIADRRRWMKILGGVTLLAVIGQGVLGGLRVRMNSTDLAFLHGCTAQAFFALMVALCVFTGKGWINAPETPEQVDTRRFRRRGLVTFVMVYAQIVLGAWVRHYGSPIAVALHVVQALAVAGHITSLWIRTNRERETFRSLVPSARMMFGSLVFQILLGIVAWWMLRPFDGIAREVLLSQAIVRLLHQGVGAIVLASSLVFTLRSYRTLRPANSRVGNPEPADRLEVAT
jgi:cytochrome c oxidase assembly protein subunit 15